MGQTQQRQEKKKGCGFHDGYQTVKEKKSGTAALQEVCYQGCQKVAMKSSDVEEEPRTEKHNLLRNQRLASNVN